MMHVHDNDDPPPRWVVALVVLIGLVIMIAIFRSPR